MDILLYNQSRDEDVVMDMIAREGRGWSCYTEGDNARKYRLLLKRSMTYVAYEGDSLCGYVRSLEDKGFNIYVCDLLVDRAFRGRSIGRALMAHMYKEEPGMTIYVMSDENPYYDQLGYTRVGSVYEVDRPAPVAPVSEE